MAKRHQIMFGDDLPKENPWLHDRLGFAPFAKRVADTIVNLRAPNGYVIGLHGQWGSGKSSVLNFIKAYIGKHNSDVIDQSEKVVIIDFRPWIVSGHQDLISTFFKILAENLKPQDSQIKRYFRGIFGAAKDSTDNLIDAVATVALTIDPSGGVASRFAGGIAKTSVNEMAKKFLNEPLLQKAYEQLRSQLAKERQKFLVIIDDLDRLEVDEVKSIMQMVKTVGRLPNIIYILSYDREIVWSSLESISRTGPKFGEKIVQQELELPRPGQNMLFFMLDKEIGFLTGSTDESSRWSYIVRDGVHRWIRSPRDVLRLSNAVKFSWPALEGELDPQDLLAMEGLRLFDDIAFNWIRESRDFLFLEGRFVLSRDEVRQAAADSLKSRIPGESQAQILRIISVLFPQSDKWFEGKESMSEESFTEVTRRRGVGCVAGYDAYFSLHPSADEISKTDLNNLMQKLDDADAIESTVRLYLGTKDSRGRLMIGKLLDELRIQYRGENSVRPTGAMLEALFRIGEEVITIESSGDMFALSPRAQLSFLIENMLNRWGKIDAGIQLVKAFEKSNSPTFAASIYVDRGRELGIFESSANDESPILMEDFDKIGSILLRTIEVYAASGELSNAPFYFDIARAWAQRGGALNAKQWLSDGIEGSIIFMEKTCRGLVNHSVGNQEREYFMRRMPPSELYDYPVLVRAGKRYLSGHDLTNDQRNLFAEVVRGLEQRTPKEEFGS